MNKVVLSPSETQAITLACGKAKCTLTALVNSIMILADVERALSTLYADAKMQDSRSQSQPSQTLSTLVEENWHKSEVWLVPANPVDMRRFVWPQAQVLHGPTTTSGGLVNLLVQSYHSMDVIRKCISFEGGKIHRSWYDNPTFFWDHMVKDTQVILKACGKQLPHAYHQSVVMSETLVSTLDNSAAASLPNIPGIVSSSLGNLERLGVYIDFSPLAQKSKVGTDAEPPFLIQNVGYSGRGHHSPITVGIVSEYNSHLVLTFMASKNNQTVEGWASFDQAVRDGFKQIIQGVLAKEATKAVKL
ncbi:hypothetical protein D9758_011407 [Tetrapyrgos nigripes]|uniref:Uncharacterized protein n=1 Tax=Tetrapyrgos nigripes TaxID=182062 RepID=A0A8H5FQZ8_9AGAR|nr:hypothetical protein D9758_011407 [Tetrapyrgos nigripes]